MGSSLLFIQGWRDGSGGPSHQTSQGLKRQEQRREPADKGGSRPSGLEGSGGAGCLH